MSKESGPKTASRKKERPSLLWRIRNSHQKLHRSKRDRDYRKSPEAVAFVNEHLHQAQAFKSDIETLTFASEQVSLDGLYIEMGVSSGKTVNLLAKLNPERIIHGFDSFEGLPEDWIRKDRIIPSGTFARKNGNLPQVRKNVRLYKGWFKDTLPLFRAQHSPSSGIAFLHIDCDLYSSTVDTFNALGEQIKPGTIIAFDELYNYPGFENHELKAFQEFLQKRNLGVTYIGYNALHQQVVAKIVSR